MTQKYSLAVSIILLFASSCQAQYSSSCPLAGAVFPPPKNVLDNSTGIIPCALASLKEALAATINNESLFDSANTTFQLSLFTKDSELLSFGHVGTDLNEGALTSGSLDGDTIFRIGSVSKLLTVYALLNAVGLDRMSDPVTKWVPELAALPESGIRSPVAQVKWDEVTIGALAGQQAGLARDLSLGDLALRIPPAVAEQVALPVLSADEIPTCGVDNLLPPCSREEFFKGLEKLHPITSVFHTPVYSNLAFQILGYALEAMANQSFASVFEASLLHPLNLTRTSLEAPRVKDNVIIPEDEYLSWWNVSTGDFSPEGGMYSSAADLTVLGQSILNSTLLSRSTTRQWLSTSSRTADPHWAVGLPWEIHRLLIPLAAGSDQTRLVDLFTKNGRLGSYASLFALSPEHDFGFALLLAGPSETAQQQAVSAAMNVIGDVVADTMVPAFEQAARLQAAERFAGLYTDGNMTIAVTADDAGPGLRIANWTSGDLDLLLLFAGIPADGANVRLYPVDLEGGGEIAFRAVFEPVREPSYTAAHVGGTFSHGCAPWGAIDSPQYGNVGFDDFVFEMNGGGAAVAVTPRVVRKTLKRAG